MRRRDFLATALAAAPAGRAAARTHANIVIVMADDMGFSDLGCYGGEVSTPNLDKLARGGVRFTQFYNAARCCPSRASLLTGLAPHQAGVGNMVNDMGHPSYQGYLNDRCVTIAEALRPSGYRTYMAGKWHVGEQRPHWPTDRGFDRYFGLISGASNYWTLGQGRTMALDDKPYQPEGERFYMTDAFTDHACEFLDDHRKHHAEKPFFLYLAYTAPHWPLHAWPDDIAKYRGKYRKGWDALRRERYGRMQEMGIIDKNLPLSARDPQIPAWAELPEKEQDQQDLRMAVYAAQIDRMDQGIGRVLSKLPDDTLVLFLADNGGCHEERIRGENPLPPGPRESFTSYGRAWANASNTPFRMYKHWVHEGGIASPLIMAKAGRPRANGGWDEQPAQISDLMATCLDAANATYPASIAGREIIPTEGRSLLPALEGKPRQVRQTLFWEHEGNRAVRHRDWKLVAEIGKPWELYNLRRDRVESKNLAREQPGRVAQMSKMYAEWAERCGVVPFDELRRNRPPITPRPLPRER